MPQREVTVDSGACETVIPSKCCAHVKVVPSDQSLRGDLYEVANGHTVQNIGERRCKVMTAGSREVKHITFQCADIHKPLLSSACAADAGFDTWLGKEGGVMRHRDSKEEIPIYRRDNLYFVDMWVNALADDEGQGQSDVRRPE